MPSGRHIYDDEQERYCLRYFDVQNNFEGRFGPFNGFQ